MTDTPANDFDPIAEAKRGITIATAEYTYACQASGDAPLPCAAEALETLVAVLSENIPNEVIRHALLIALDRTHDKAMNFIQIANMTEAMKQIAIARKSIDAKKAGIIMPGVA